jgi:hypothetical protein
LGPGGLDVRVPPATPLMTNWLPVDLAELASEGRDDAVSRHLGARLLVVQLGVYARSGAADEAGETARLVLALNDGRGIYAR